MQRLGGVDTATKFWKRVRRPLALPIWTDIMLASQKEGYPFNAIRTRAASEGQAVLVCRESNQLAHSGCQYAKTAYYETTVGYRPLPKCVKSIFPLRSRARKKTFPMQSRSTVPMTTFRWPNVDETDGIPYATPI